VKITLTFLLLISGGCVLLSDVSASGADLFNGKDFSGWAFFERGNTDPINTWSISDGLIHCTGKPNGYLRTEKKYSDSR
jgi:hypothetical protein